MARRYDVRGGSNRLFIESSNYVCTSPCYYYDSTRNILVPTNNFKLSTTIPS